MNQDRYSFHDLHPDAGCFLEDVISGLSRPRKELSPKYFYDARGCELFDAICELPEYYPTRTEMAMMQGHAGDMSRHLGPQSMLIEYGSGNSRKTHVLIGSLAPVAYVPIDIAGVQLRASAARLTAAFPGLRVIAVCADYSKPFTLPEIDGISARRRVIYFPGSTIGNFTVQEALDFLRNARSLAGAGGAMLIGVDLKKDPALLNAAYNDSRGVTADFNLNLLCRINLELGADFDISSFRHHAFYNAALGRIEMHLQSLREQRVRIGGLAFRFSAGETIHTENSYKYSPDEFRQLASQAGFDAADCWIDPQRLFSVHCLTVPG